MKRDMELVRRIVLATTELEPFRTLDGLPGVDPYAFTLHVAWMQEAGLLHANVNVPLSASEAQYAFVFRLTWAGCEFADAVRDDGIWRKVKDKVLRPGMSFTFDIVKEALKAEIAHGLPTLRALGGQA